MIRVILVVVTTLFGAGCSSVFYQPGHGLYYEPSKFGFEAQEFVLTASNGEKLFAWYLPTKKKALGTIIQFHGNAENMSSHYLSLAWLVPEGYNLFVFDYRGYGKSEGTPSQKNTYEDGLLALKKAYELHQTSGGRRFVVVGQSLGGVIAARALKDFQPKSAVSAVILDSTFASYKQVAVKALARKWFTWPISWLGWVLVSDAYSSEEALKECYYPLLILHDRNDKAVSYQCGKHIEEIASCPKKEFWSFDRGGHVAAFAYYESENRARFIEFLKNL